MDLLDTKVIPHRNLAGELVSHRLRPRFLSDPSEFSQNDISTRPLWSLYELYELEKRSVVRMSTWDRPLHF